MRARIRGKYRQSPFSLQVTQTDRGVFFDRIMDNQLAREKMLVLHTTPKQARALARWILQNVEAE